MTKSPRRVPKDLPESHFRDCKYVMDLALQRPGLQNEFATPGAATHFRLRCHQYRAQIRRQQDQVSGHIPGFQSESAYDLLYIRQVNAEGDADRKAGCIVQFDHEIKTGVIRDPATGEIFTPDLTANLLPETGPDEPESPSPDMFDPKELFK